MGRTLLLGLLLALSGPARAVPMDALDPATRQLVETAQAAQQAHDWRRATAAWKLVLGKDPVFPLAVVGLGRAQEAQGDKAGAARTYGRLPADPDAVEALARLVEVEDPARAADLYGRLQSLRLGDPEPHRLQVEALTRSDPKAALQELGVWLALVEGEPDGRTIIDVALALRALGEEESARTLLERYLAAWPEGTEAGEAQGRLDRMAVETAARELTVGASQPLSARQQERVEAARRRAARGQAEPALAELREVVQEAPRSADAWGALGDVHVLLGRIDEAERAYAWAAALAPEEATWQARLGLLLADRYGGRRHREADELLSRALALRPTWSELRYRQGQVRQGLGDWDAAAEAYEAYLGEEPQGPFAEAARQAVADLRRTAPAPPEIPRIAAPDQDMPAEALDHYRIARVYWDQGDMVSSRSELDLALAQAPAWPAALNLLAALHMRAGEAPQALDAWQRSLAADPQQPLVKLNLGQRLRQQGDLPGARALLDEAAQGGAEDAWYLLAEMSWQEHHLLEARRYLDHYAAVSTGGISQEPARLLRGRVEGRIRLVEGGATGAVGLVLLGGGAWLVRRRTGRTLADLVARAPEVSHDLARLLSAIRHEVLKHNTTLLDEVAQALENGDHHAVRWAALRLFGDGRGSEGVVDRFESYLAAISRLGRQHGVRLDLRRRDPVLAPMWRAMRRLRGLARQLRHPAGAGEGVPAELRRISVSLNDQGYQALGRLVREMGTLRLDGDLLRAVDARVRSEPAFDGEELPPLELDVPEQAVPLKVFRGDLEDIVANLLRNAYRAEVEAVGPGLRRVGLSVFEEEDEITGLEHVVLELRDNAPGKLTDAMIRGRSIGRGLGLAVDLITRHEGSITVAPAREGGLSWTKAVVVRLRRAEEGEEP